MQTIDHTTGEILGTEAEEFRVLDVYGPPSTPVAPRVDWLATLSAGTKTTSQNGKEVPSASRDGRLYLHDESGRATELAKLLAASDGKRLTIAVASDRLADVIQQSYRRYSATAVEVFGDDLSLTEIVDGRRTTWPVGTARYEELRATCKVAWSLYFVLARWVGQQSQLCFPDGFGMYRWRSTSRHSLASVVGKLQEIQGLTGGRLTGVPLELSLTYRDVAGGDGKRHKIPVCTLALKPPEAIQLTSGNFRELISGALREGEALRMLPAPRPETLADALRDAGEEADDSIIDLRPTGAAVAQVQTAAVACDASYWRGAWFASARGTDLESDWARAAFLHEYTEGQTTSLAEYLATATEEQASGLIAALAERRERARLHEQARRLAEALPTGGQRIDTSNLAGSAIDVAPESPVSAPPEPPAAAPSPDLLPKPEDLEKYANGLELAQRLDIDVAPFLVDATVTRARLIELGVKLRRLVDAETAKRAGKS